MKRSLVGVVVGAVAWISSCSNDKSSTPPLTTEGATTEGTPDDAGAHKGVDCTHPGAGKPTGDGHCECSTARNIAGEWTTKRTCREGDICPTKNKEDALVFTQNGTHVTADKGDSYALEGTLCGDVLVWTGGPKDGLNPECGDIRFTDDSHYTSDSCYVASGECKRTHNEGCPSLKGQCTGTGAKKPEASVAIKRVICN